MRRKTLPTELVVWWAAALVLTFLVLTSGMLGATSEPPLALLLKWGSAGSGISQFNQPRGIAVDAAGNVYVADMGNHRIQKFNANGVFLAQWGSKGTGNGQFDYPAGIAVDTNGNVYVAEYMGRRVQKFDSNGNFLTKWGTGVGAGPSTFCCPLGVAVGPEGNIYVVEQYPRIQVFTPNGVYIREWGGYVGIGVEPNPKDRQNEFEFWYGIAVDAEGSVYVADGNQLRVLKFDSTGNLLAKWKGVGIPIGVTVDAANHVYVSGDGRVRKFTSSGTLLTAWGGNGEFNGIWHVALDAGGNVYSTENSAARVQKWGVPSLIAFDFQNGAAGAYDVPASSVNSPITSAVFTSDTSQCCDHGVQQWNVDHPGDKVYVARSWSSRGPTFVISFTASGPWTMTGLSLQQHTNDLDPGGVSDPSGRFYRPVEVYAKQGGVATLLGVINVDECTVGGCTDVKTLGGLNHHFDAGPAEIVLDNIEAASNTSFLMLDDIKVQGFKETAPADAIAPTVTASVSPSANAAGWHKTTATVSFAASDNAGGSGVKEIVYSVNGGTPVVTSGSTASTSFATDGQYNVSYYARDKAGNQPAPQSVTVKVDTTPPTISGASMTPANAANWNNTDVAVKFTCSDATSGIETCPGHTTVATEGAAQSVSATAVDQAGNTATGLVSGINIDKTAPAITGMPAAGTCSLWPANHKMITVATVGTSDGLSGMPAGSLILSVASSEPDNGLGDGDTAGDIAVAGLNPMTIALRAERSGRGPGRIYSVKAMATDLAGNTTTATSSCTVPRNR